MLVKPKAAIGKSTVRIYGQLTLRDRGLYVLCSGFVRSAKRFLSKVKKIVFIYKGVTGLLANFGDSIL